MEAQKTFSVFNYNTNEYYGKITASTIEQLDEVLVKLLESLNIFNFDWNMRSDGVAAIVYIKNIQ